MPSESRWVALRDDLRDTLAGMSIAEGYWFDYGDVVIGSATDWETEKDFDHPRVFLMWDGEIEGDPLSGVETATRRFRHWDRWIISFAVKDEDPELQANRIRQDVHAALLAGTSRLRSGTRVATFDTGAAWEPFYEGGTPIGGVLALTYTVRWDHITGDMATQ